MLQCSVKIAAIRFIPFRSSTMGSFSIWHWLIVLAIVLVVFGTKKLGNIGKDLGSAVKGFKDGIKDGQAEEQVENTAAGSSKKTIDVEAREKV